MESRNMIIHGIAKSTDSNRLLVFKAGSLEDQIVFYLNDTQYFSAVDCSNGNILVKLEEEPEKGERKVPQKSALGRIKDNFKDNFKKSFIYYSLALAGILLFDAFILVLAYFLVEHISACLYIIYSTFFLLDLLRAFLRNYLSVSPAQKSKHSAEHMMVNFLETYKRLPRSMQELKQSSRFSPDCGDKKKIQGFAEDWIRLIFSVILSSILSSFISTHTILKEEFIIFILIHLSTFYILTMKKINFKLMTKPINEALTKLMQCASTTKKVKDRDLRLAYVVAREWIMVVYPEFYHPEDDVFFHQYFFKS